jgi:ribosome hibernation promoting factor
VDVAVSSRHMEVSPALRASVIDKIGRLDRYVEGMERADVHFSEERNPRIENKEICEVTLQGHGHYVRAKVAAADPYAAVDAAVEKLEHQLLKLKSRLIARYHGRVNGAKVRTRGAEVEPDDDTRDLAEAEGEQALSGEPEPVVVKTKRFIMNPMTLEEAMLQMEMLDHRFFLFVRVETGAPSVLYQRDEGDLGLIEIST